MKPLILKSNVNWCTHELYELVPIDNKSNEKVYKFKSEHPVELIRDSDREIIGISFRYGPTLYIGQINNQIGLPLKEVCECFNKETGGFNYLALVFDDILSNKKTRIDS